MKTSHVYTRVTGCKVAYMKKGQQNRPRFSHGWLRLRGSRTDSGNGSDMVGSHSGGEYSSNNSLLALWLEVDDTSCCLIKGMVLQDDAYDTDLNGWS